MQRSHQVGWREWAYLPALDIGPIKAKMDTGARTTALHAFDIVVADAVEFKVHTVQGRDDFHIDASAPLVEYRDVRDSGGTTTRRPIIETALTLGGHTYNTEVSLIDRGTMAFRLLVGRTALGPYSVECGSEYVHGTPSSVRGWSP